jgi:hypothetical protein
MNDLGGVERNHRLISSGRDTIIISSSNNYCCAYLMLYIRREIDSENLLAALQL